MPSKSSSSVRKSSTAFSAVVSREKDNTINEVAARKLQTAAEEKELEKNVYSNEQAIKANEDELSQGTKSDIVLVRSDAGELNVPLPDMEQIPTPVRSRSHSTTTNDPDHLYYECTHFPYDPERASLASTYPEPVMSDVTD